MTSWEPRGHRGVDDHVTQTIGPHDASPFLRIGPIAPLFAGLLGLAALGCSGTDANNESKSDDQHAGDAGGPTADGPKPVDAFANDDARAKRVSQIADRVDADSKAASAGKTFEAYRADLQSVIDRGEDRFLRANAAVLLGSLLEERGDVKGAIAYYRHASKIVPDDAGPHMALALGLARDKQYADAAQAQAKAAEFDPNNLENWLALGELRIRAGDKEAATGAYVDYERVRKSLIDGLTGRAKEGGDYLVTADERVACARNLAVAADTGTAFALLYALETEGDPKVRAAVAEVMGVQRLQAYRKRLSERVKTEPDPQTKEAMQWALGEIMRDPVEVTKGAPTTLGADDPRAADDADVEALSGRPEPAPTPGIPTDTDAPEPTAPDGGPSEGADAKAPDKGAAD